MLRNYLADASCDSAVVHIRVPDFASIIGSGSNSCLVHGRFILIDNVTGYRSQYQQKSFADCSIKNAPGLNAMRVNVVLRR